MPLLSILTAVHAGRKDLLAEAGASLADQKLPAGWQVEWIVQEDGPEPHLAPMVEKFTFAHHEAHRESLGIATTRNLALTRASGELLYSLDSDDLLLPGALSVAIDAFDTYPQIHWVSAQADDLMPDFMRVPFPPLIPPGYVESGAVSAFVEANDMVPIACPGLMLCTATARALGGWAANPRWEDTALFVAIAELTPGYITPEVTWLYRQHDDQTTRQTMWPTLKTELWAMIRQRIDALRAVGLRIDATHSPALTHRNNKGGCPAIKSTDRG
jgi:glycosyltransferase involved in cell wall biosynthesis